MKTNKRPSLRYNPFVLHNSSHTVIKNTSGKDLYVKYYDIINKRDMDVPYGFTSFLSLLAEDMLERYSVDAEQA